MNDIFFFYLLKMIPLAICEPLKANSSKSTSDVISIFPGSESASTTSCL